MASLAYTDLEAEWGCTFEAATAAEEPVRASVTEWIAAGYEFIDNINDAVADAMRDRLCTHYCARQRYYYKAMRQLGAEFDVTKKVVGLTEEEKNKITMDLDETDDEMYVTETH